MWLLALLDALDVHVFPFMVLAEFGQFPVTYKATISIHEIVRSMFFFQWRVVYMWYRLLIIWHRLWIISTEYDKCPLDVISWRFRVRFGKSVVISIWRKCFICTKTSYFRYEHIILYLYYIIMKNLNMHIRFFPFEFQVKHDGWKQRCLM